MSKYHMISGGDGGYNEPVYADSWGDLEAIDDALDAYIRKVKQYSRVK